MGIDLTKGQWLNPPQHSQITADMVELTTEPGSDFWQRSYYGFRNDNAHALQLEHAGNFTFTTRADFQYQKQFDQCGVIIYLNSENWFKASIEFETPNLSRLGSVVTNHGYSDWATTDIQTVNTMWYRLSRRGPDFLIESSSDGIAFKQMRIFHLHQLGETTPEMGAQNPPQPPAQSVRFGVYACSPNPSSFTARFSQFKLEPCQWLAHQAPE
jgi:uncharacterized protein